MKWATGRLAISAAVLAISVGHSAQAQQAAPPAPRVAAWDSFADGIRELPSRMLAKLPLTMQQDPRIQQEVSRLALAAVSMSALDMLANDGDHPAFVPSGNLVLNVAEPNPDTIYRAARITPGGSYRLRGRRGHVRIASIVQAGPLPVEPGFAPGSGPHTFHDLNALKSDREGRFEVMISPERPLGYSGDWWKLEAPTSRLVLRLVSSDWKSERDPSLSIERIDVPVRRPRAEPATLAAIAR